MANFHKMIRVAIFEYQRQVLNWRFWLGMVSLPLMAVVLFAITFWAFSLSLNDAPVGVVGAGDILLTPPQGEHNIYTFNAYPDEAAARAALLDQKIQAYYVLPAGYPREREVRLVYLKQPRAIMTSELNDLLRHAALTSLPAERAQRLLMGSRVILQAGRFEASAQIPTLVRMFIAICVVYILLLLNSSAATYMINSITEERNNRTLELLVTSTSHSQLVTGKVFGQLAVVLTLAFIWGGIPALAFMLARQMVLPLLGDVFTWQQLAVFLAAGFLNLMLVSVLLSILGVTIFDPSEAQLAAILFNFGTLAPVMLNQALVDAPSGPVSLFLTFFPFTSVGALILRMAVGSVPAWQVVLSLLLLAASTRAAFWLAGRMFWRALNEHRPIKLNFTKLKSSFQRVRKPRHA